MNPVHIITATTLVACCQPLLAQTSNRSGEMVVNGHVVLTRQCQIGMEEALTKN